MSGVGTSRIAGVVHEMVAVEARAPVNELTFAGICVWPIVRRIHHFSRLEKDKKQPTKLAEIEDPASTNLMIRMDEAGMDRAAELARQRACLAGNEPCDALFVSRLLDHTDRVNGLYYNRLMDPYLRLCRGRYRHLKLELTDTPVNAFDERFEPTVPLCPPDWRSGPYADNMPIEIAGFAPIADAFAGVSATPPTFNQLVSYLPRLWARHQYFTELLQRIRPKVVFVICYYSADMLALMWACRRLGIPTVDIQHGQQGAYHGMYNHWTASPPQGYDLLPDHFFCWGEPVTRYHAQYLPAERRRPHSRVAGHPWIGLWQQPDTVSFAPELQAFCKTLEDRKVVVAGLQPTEQLLPDELPAAMRATPEWLWLLRLHPHQRYRIPHITAFMQAAGITNFEVDLSTRAPLYALLRNADHLVTQFSSVAWEAVAFGLPVTIIDQAGVDSYRDAIKAGQMAFAPTAAEIKVALEKPAQPSVPTAPFIEPALALTEKALSEVLG